MFGNFTGLVSGETICLAAYQSGHKRTAVTNITIASGWHHILLNWDSGNSSANFATRFGGLPFSVETGGHQAAAAVTIGFFDGSETDMLVAHISSGLVKFFENGDAMYSYSESAGDRIAGYVTYTTT